MSLDIHNPYCSLWHDTAMSFPAPWDEQKTYERSPFSFFGSLLQSSSKSDINSSSSNCRSSKRLDNEDDNSLPTFTSLYGSVNSVAHNFSMDSSEISHKSRRKSSRGKKRSVKFSNTVNCILIPCREDLAQMKCILWQSDDEIANAISEAQNEIEGTLTSCESGLSLYSTMSLIYRPCQNRPHSQLRILIIDDSMVSVKMLIYMLTKGKKMMGIHDDLVIHHVATPAAALEQFQTRSYNIVIIDQNLTVKSTTRSSSLSVSSDGNTSHENSDGGASSDDDSVFTSNKLAKTLSDYTSSLQGHDLCKLLRKTENEGCVIVGISAMICDLTSSLATSEESDISKRVKKQFLDCGADFVWPKPLPTPTMAWDDLLQRLPLEF